jgi:hypothetical protein
VNDDSPNPELLEEYFSFTRLEAHAACGFIKAATSCIAVACNRVLIEATEVATEDPLLCAISWVVFLKPPEGFGIILWNPPRDMV